MKYRISGITFCVVFMLVCIGNRQSLYAQNVDSTQVMEAISIFFDGLATKDSTLMLSVSDPDSRVVLTSFKTDGSSLMRPISMQDFAGFISRQTQLKMVEVYWNPEVVVHDNLATVMLDYNFYIDDQLDHCGKDALQLFRSAEGWKILALADTQRRTGCVARD